VDSPPRARQHQPLKNGDQHRVLAASRAAVETWFHSQGLITVFLHPKALPHLLREFVRDYLGRAVVHGGHRQSAEGETPNYQ
jgi:hypothetical protein